jgi:general secretion pathway protein D
MIRAGGQLIIVFIAGTLLSCSSPDLHRAKSFADRGEWDKAVALYREALKKNPFSPEIQDRLDEAKAKAAESHYGEGRKHLEEHRLFEAIREFKLALGMDPSKQEYFASMSEALRLKEAREQLQAGEKLMSLGRLEEAQAAYERSVELDPSLTQSLEKITEITKQQRVLKTVGTYTQPVSLRFQNAKLKEVFEILARTAGVNVIFDKEIRDDPVTIFIKELPFDEALNLILSTNSLVAQRVAPDTILVMPNSKQKQAQYQDLLLRTFYLSNAKAKEAVNLVRTMLDSKKIYVDEKVNAIVVREEPAKLQLAERLLYAIDRREPEVELDLEVLEINRTKNWKYGFNFAKQAGLGITPPGTTGSISTNPTQFTFSQLTALGPESYLFTFPASVIIDFFKQDSDAKTLASPKLRVINNKPATISIGDKQPILLSTTNVLPGQAATGAVPTTSTVTSIEFKDVGVKLTVEPSVNLNDEVTLKIKVEVTRLGDQVTLQASPEIKQFRFGTRMAETTLMLKDDETVVLGGLIQDEDRKNRTTVPVLGDIPFLGHLFSSVTIDRISTEVVLTITPRIVRTLGTPPIAGQAFWSGTENTYATSQVFPPYASRTSTAAKSSDGKDKRVSEPPKSEPPKAPLAATAADSAKSVETQQPPPGTEAAPSRPSAPPLALSAPPTAADNQAKTVTQMIWRPLEMSASPDQELRMDIVADGAPQSNDTMVNISFDPQAVEFRRIAPGNSPVSARMLDGKVSITVGKQARNGGGDTVASVFVAPKRVGDHIIAMETQAVGAPQSAAPSTAQAVIHVK